MRISSSWYTPIIIAGSMGIFYEFLLIWLTPFEALRLTLIIPFFFVIPGGLIVRAYSLGQDVIERSTYTVVLSLVLNTLPLFFFEEWSAGLPRARTIIVIGAVNILVFVFVLGKNYHRRRLRE